MKYAAALFFWLVALGPVARGDSPAQPYPYIVASPNGRFYFKMLPGEYEYVGSRVVLKRPFIGIAYRVEPTGESTEIWRTRNWYEFQVYLSDDGDHLVRMGPWAWDQVNHADLAVAFYERGKLLRAHLVCDLLKDPSCVSESVSHYDWQAYRSTQPTGLGPKGFHLVLRDGSAYDFNVFDGAIQAASHDALARQTGNVRRGILPAEAEYGAALFQASRLPRWYGPHFEFDRVYAEAQGNQSEGTFSFRLLDAESRQLIHPRQPTWHARLTPKPPLAKPCLVWAEVPVRADGALLLSLPPERVRFALESALKHPLFSSRSGAPLTLHIAGDWLSRHFVELRSLHRKLKGRELPDSELLQWAQIEIEPAPTDDAYNYFLDTVSGEVIYKQMGFPFAPVWLDARGGRLSAIPAARK